MANVILFLAASVVVIKYLLPYVLPFALAAVLAMAIDPLVTLLEKKLHVKRGWATMLGLMLVVAVVASVGFLVVSQLAAELNTIITRMPDYTTWVIAQVQNAALWFDHLMGQYAPAGIPAPLMSRIQQQLGDVAKGLQGWANSTLTALARLPSLFMLITVTALATYFIIRDKRLVVNSLLGLLPAAWRRGAIQVKADLWVTAAGYLRAELILIMITIAIATTGLLLLHARYALILGLLAGVVDLLPVVGPALIFVPWAAYAMLTGSPAFGVGLLITLAIMFTVRQLLEPRLLAGQLGLHPLVTLLAIWLGLQVFGTWGLVIGPFLAVLLRSLVRANIIPVHRS